MYLASIRAHRRAFSLVELVIVLVIIGIVSAIAIPRLSRGVTGANDNALRGNLAVLRSAIEYYAAEHDGTYPTAAAIVNQLTQYTTLGGAAQATADATHIYGPYLKEIPDVNIGARKGDNGIAAADAAGIGWLYVEATGKISANTAAVTDAEGVLYTAY